MASSDEDLTRTDTGLTGIEALDEDWTIHSRKFLGVKLLEHIGVFALALLGLVVPLVAFGVWEVQFMHTGLDDKVAYAHSLMPLCQLFSQVVSVHVIVNHVTHHCMRHFSEEKVSVFRLHFSCPGAPVWLTAVLLSLKSLKTSVPHFLKEPTQEPTIAMLNMLMAFVFVFSVLACLDRVHDLAWTWARGDGEQVLDNTNVKKWRTIGHAFRHWGQPQKDKVYSFPAQGNHISPAFVLAEIASLYILLAKAVTGIMYIAFLVGIDLYENIVILLIISGTSAAFGSMQLHYSFSALIALAVSKPFYVGEIVGVSTAGNGPADAPTSKVVGFVEAITLFHVVMRDFKKKQIFIPLPEFAKLTLHNWTRRPAKLCYWLLTVSAGDKNGDKVSALACFVRKWIKAHELIDQTGYTKAVVKAAVGSGLKLEVVFYPKIGKNVYQLRAEFVVTLMDAATRLGLTLIPEDLVTPYPETLPASQNATAAPETLLGQPLHNKCDIDIIGAIGAISEEGTPFLSDSVLEDLLPSRPGLARKAGFE